MKTIKITMYILCLGLTTLTAQEEAPKFKISAEALELFDDTITTTGLRFEYQVEDEYTLKLTNNIYRIKLFFEERKKEAVQIALSKIMDDNTTTTGFDRMVWKKTRANGKPVYEVELKDNQLLFHIRRKEMDDETYKRLTSLGQEFLVTINS